MGRFRVAQGRHFLELAVVVVPLIAILVLQYVSSRRLAEVEVIARQTTVARYLNAVTAEVRERYEETASEILDVPADALAEKRFGVIKRYFERADTSAATLLFTGTLEGCWCLTQYYDPATDRMGVAADVEVDVGAERVVLRISTLLRASALPRREELRLRLDRNRIYVDEEDATNRVVYRFVADTDDRLVGFAGFVIDTHRFETEFLPRALVQSTRLLAEDMPDNLIVRATDDAGRVVATNHVGPGQPDEFSVHFAFVFRDWELSARSRHTTAAEILESNVLSSWVLTVFMSMAVLGGILATLRAAGRERRLSRIRSAFVANVSHELRTPLASLSAFGELLRRGRVTSPEKVVDYGRHIEHESNRLRHLIDNVLDFARIESAAVEYRRREAAIDDIVRAAVNAVGPRCQRESFTIAVTCPKILLPTVFVDVQAMTQVFVNLLDNAMKYSGRSRRVCVNLDPDDDYITVSVADSGIGIAPEDQKRIFGQFYRSPAAGTTGVAGTGLGLAIVQHVVQAHGGQVEVESCLGRGATFSIRIPTADVATVRHAEDPEPGIDRGGIEAGAET